MAVAQILQPDAKAGSQFANLTDLSTTSSVPWILCTWGGGIQRTGKRALISLADRSELTELTELIELTNWSCGLCGSWGGYSAAPEGHFTSPRWRERIGWSQSRAHRRWPGKLAESTAGKFLVQLLAVLNLRWYDHVARWMPRPFVALSLLGDGGSPDWQRGQGVIKVWSYRIYTDSTGVANTFTWFSPKSQELSLKWSSFWAGALDEARRELKRSQKDALGSELGVCSVCWSFQTQIASAGTKLLKLAKSATHWWRKREACGGSWRSQLPLPSQPRWTRSKRSFLAHRNLKQDSQPICILPTQLLMSPTAFGFVQTIGHTPMSQFQRIRSWLYTYIYI